VRIRKLQLRDFRRYRELDLDFGTGLTIVRGPNEAGKSTIQRAIELGLTRRVTSAASDMTALRPWDVADDVPTVVTIDFDDDEDGATRTGHLEKIFAGSKGTVTLEYDGGTVTDPTLADQVLAELTGIPTEAFYRSTASVRHQELADLARDEAALHDRLQASISGADRGTSQAKKRLEKALHELNTKGDKNPGRLKVAELAVAQAQAAVEVGEGQLAQLATDRDSLNGALARRADAEAALVERRGMLEKARHAERLTAERDAAQDRYERYRQAGEVNEEMTRLAATHPSAQPLPVVRAGVERLRSLDVRARELRAALSGEVNVNFEVAEDRSWQPYRTWSIALIVVGLLLAVVPLVLSAANVVSLGLIPSVIGAFIAIIGLVLAFVASRLRRTHKTQAELRDVEIDRRLRGRSEMEAELVQVEQETARRLEQFGLEDLSACEDLLAREEAHVAQLDRLGAQLEGLVGREPPDTLAGTRDTAALEAAQKASALEALGPIAKEPRARERLEVEVRDLESAVERARDDEANARARVEANPVDAEQVAAQSERLAMWQEQLAGLQRRERVYAGTLAAIERAEQATMKTATRYLERRMVKDLDTVTAGRYRYVRVDDRSLDIEVRAPEKRDWVKVSTLSQGTLDLVYLTARLGLVRLVTGDRRPPLVFDDPFVTLDDGRATRALQLLKDVAADFQVIYLTTSDRYDAAADVVVELPGPSALDDGPAPAESMPAAAAEATQPAQPGRAGLGPDPAARPPDAAPEAAT
jgi:DNA repair exonuclease SbcCD ATPase subunit